MLGELPISVHNPHITYCVSTGEIVVMVVNYLTTLLSLSAKSVLVAVIINLRCKQYKENE